MAVSQENMREVRELLKQRSTLIGDDLEPLDAQTRERIKQIEQRLKELGHDEDLELS